MKTNDFMTLDAFLYALDHAAIPDGSRLWLYGPPAIVNGAAYTPLCGQARQLERNAAGVVYSDIHAIQGAYDAIFIHCPKQREETEGLLAFALKHSRACVMAVAPNDAGGGRLLNMLGAYDIPVQLLSKNKCRIVWTLQAQEADKSLVWQKLLHLNPAKLEMGGESWWSQPGLFGWDKIDSGSRLLLERLPSGIGGVIADFGCGYGYLAAMLERKYPAIERIDAYDVDARAVECCKRNAGGKINAIWADVTAHDFKAQYDAVIMNPPFHDGKTETQALGAAFIEKAWQSLTPGGRLFLVANRHLAYEKTVPGLSILFEGQGYKILSGQHQ